MEWVAINHTNPNHHLSTNKESNNELGFTSLSTSYTLTNLNGFLLRPTIKENTKRKKKYLSLYNTQPLVSSCSQRQPSAANIAAPKKTEKSIKAATYVIGSQLAS